MEGVVKPLASTVRVVEWEELPPSARDIPADFNPVAEGVLMLHQRQAVALHHSIVAIPKGRRTGITFAVMLRKTLVAAAAAQTLVIRADHHIAVLDERLEARQAVVRP